MKKIYEEKVMNLFKNSDFTTKFAALDSIEDVGGLFTEYGVEIPDAELADFINASIAANKGDELTDADLDGVSGGAPWWLVNVAWGIACEYWGGPKEAASQTYSFWKKTLGF